MANSENEEPLFIVDNRPGGRMGAEYLGQWCEISERFDIATGYFEIGALLELDGQWQQLDEIRILMGDEVTKRTRKVLTDAQQKRHGVELINRSVHLIDSGLENEKDIDPFLTGVEPAVWDFQVSGMPIVKKWLGYRTAKGAGKAMSSSSPLDHIRPTEWAPEWSTELLELLTVLHETLALLPIGIGLLDRICDGPLIPASDLPPVPDALRKPPKVTRDAGQLTLGD